MNKAKRAVFTITTYGKDGNKLATSTGFFISETGEAVSAYNIFKGAEKATITDFEGKTFLVKNILGADELYDAVKFQVEVPKKAVFLPIAAEPVANGTNAYLLLYSTGKNATFKSGAITEVSKLKDPYKYYKMAVALEEQKAMGENIPGEFITNLKTSLMGPLAGMGDTIWQGVVIPILLAVCIDLTRSGSGNVWGAVIYAVVIVVAAYALSYWNFMFGYKAGSEAIMDFLEKGILNKLIKGASIMGCMVMGGLIVNYVKAVCGLKIVSSTTTYSIQTNFLDQVCPSILPLAVTLLVYYLMNKKRWSSLKIIGLIVVIGIVGGVTGILAY